MVAVALNTLTDSIFIANRRAEFHTLVYTVFGVVKLILPLLLVALGSLGIFTAYIAAVCVSLGLSFFFMKRAAGYRLFTKPNWSFISRSRQYTSSNYLVSLLWGLPSQLMPTIIVARLGDANAAYFSMAWTMANLLYVIPSAITNSMLAETSHKLEDQSKNLRHVMRILTIILVPVVGLSILIAPYLLRLFGGNYEHGGTTIFQLLALSTFFIAGIAVGNTIMNIEQRSKGIVAVQIVTAGTTLLLAWLLVKMGLVGVGLAMLGGNIAGCTVLMYLLTSRRRKGTTRVSQTVNGPERAVMRKLLGYYGLQESSIGKDIGGGDRSSTNIITAGSNKYVLKIYRNDKRTFKNVEDEVKFTQFLADSGVPTQQIITSHDGSLLHTITQQGVTWTCVVTKFEAGQTPAVYSPELVANMAEIQALIHARGIEYVSIYGEVNKKLRLGPYRILGTKGLSHFDYDGSNILFDKSSKVACVLDFEGMRYDFLVVCIEFALLRLYSETRDPALIEQYLKAYRGIRKLTWLESLSIRLALVAHSRSWRLVPLRF